MSGRGRPRRWRRALLGALAAVVLLVGGAYVALLILTPDAPPAPSFDRTVVPKFAPRIDGEWYGRSCRPFQVIGGWLLPEDGAPLLGGKAIDEPIDLTGLRMDGKPIPFTVDSAHLSIRWQNGGLSIEGDPAGDQVGIRLGRRRSTRC